MLEKILSESWNQVTLFVPKFLIAVILVLACYYLARVTRSALIRAYKMRSLAPGPANLSIEVAYWGIILLGVFLGLQQFFDVATFLAGLGLLGFAVGFALQDVIKNLASGVLLILQAPFVVGENIGVGSFEGTVEVIGLRSIALRTWDGRLVQIPNADLLTTPMVNYTRSPKRRVQVTVGVAYGSDLEKVQTSALQAVANLPGLQAEPAPLFVFDVFGPSSVDFNLYFWVDVNTCGVFAAKDFAIRSIHQAFEEAGIEIPFPIVNLVSPRA